jgi:hypothetical protein
MVWKFASTLDIYWETFNEKEKGDKGKAEAINYENKL